MQQETETVPVQKNLRLPVFEAWRIREFLFAAVGMSVLFCPRALHDGAERESRSNRAVRFTRRWACASSMKAISTINMAYYYMNDYITGLEIE